MNFIKNIFFILIIIISFLTSCGKRDKNKDVLSVNVDLLQTGDIVLKRGKGMVSNFIVNLLKEEIPISHCGIISKSGDSIYVIHTVASELSDKDGMQTMLFDGFLKDCEKKSLYILRHRSSMESCAKIEQNAQKYLKNKVPFDYKFDISNKEAIYCSELVYHILMDSFGQNYLKSKIIQNNEVLMFNSLIDDTINFQHIYSGI